MNTDKAFNNEVNTELTWVETHKSSVIYSDGTNKERQ